MNRVVAWDGCRNVRDLGGLPLCGGGATAFKAIVRADHPSNLSPTGWTALLEYGIRTIISLTTDGVDLKGQLLENAPSQLTTMAIAIEDLNDADFKRRWADNGLWGTPLYWEDALTRWPDRHAAAVRAVAQAEPGSVLVHCGRGHDRTGIVSLLLLRLAGVEPGAIAADYELSQANLTPQEREGFVRVMTGQGVTAREAVLHMLDTVPVEEILRRGGLTAEDISRVRTRLLE